MNQSLPAQELIERAFGLAKKAGKTEWWVMAVPVLKNRLLQLTSGTFKESEFGADNFWDFLEKNADIVRIDKSFLPGAAILTSAEQEPPTTRTLSSSSAEQIRPDLWRAVLDYSSGKRYRWDPASASANAEEDESEGPHLPTVSAEEMKQWKTEFLESLPGEAGKAERLVTWMQEGLPTAALPVAFRPPWNRFLKQKVQNRLKEWFNEQHIVPPPINTGRSMSPHEIQTEALRSFVIDCIKHMSKDELDRLSIPSSAAFRVKPHN